ncbi:696_t:CDS:10, partial [Entrophospora sp. SA101]
AAYNNFDSRVKEIVIRWQEQYESLKNQMDLKISHIAKLENAINKIASNQEHWKEQARKAQNELEITKSTNEELNDQMSSLRQQLEELRNVKLHANELENKLKEGERQIRIIESKFKDDERKWEMKLKDLEFKDMQSVERFKNEAQTSKERIDSLNETLKDIETQLQAQIRRNNQLQELNSIQKASMEATNESKAIAAKAESTFAMLNEQLREQMEEKNKTIESERQRIKKYEEQEQKRLHDQIGKRDVMINKALSGLQLINQRKDLMENAIVRQLTEEMQTALMLDGDSNRRQGYQPPQFINPPWKPAGSGNGFSLIKKPKSTNTPAASKSAIPTISSLSKKTSLLGGSNIAKPSGGSRLPISDKGTNNSNIANINGSVNFQEDHQSLKTLGVRDKSRFLSGIRGNGESESPINLDQVPQPNVNMLSQFNYYFNKNDHLRPFVDKNWSSLCTERSRTATWWATLGSCLYSTKDIFVAKDENNRSASSNFCLMDPNLWNIKPGCFGVSSTHSRIPSRAVKETINNPRSSSTEFGQSGEQNNLRNGFKYLPCKSDKLFSYTQYRNSELRPYGVRLSKEDASLSVWISGDQLTTTTDHGFSMARANCPVKEGKWFYEVFIDRGGEGKVDGKDGAHVRVGWARREGNRNSPVGSDGYSYGIRDLTGQKVHMSHVKKFGEPFKTGDVIGIYISLPPLKKVSKGYKYKAPKRQRIPILFKGETIFEYKDFKPTQPELPTLPGSKIIVYKNGICQGIAFENLFSFFPIIDKYTADDDLIEDDGSLGYYPAVSMFRERYMEYVAEDVVYDIVDEIELWDWMRGQNKNKASMVNKRPYSAILANNNNNSQEFSDGNSKKFKQEKQEPKIEEEYDDSKYLAQDWDLFI